MVGKYQGPTPDGQETATWYRLSYAEVMKLIQDEVVHFHPDKTPQDLVDAEILAYKGMEDQVENMIRSWAP